MTEEECILPLHTLIGLVKDVKNYEYCPQLTCLKLVPQTEIEGFPTSAFEFKAPYEWIYTKYLEQDFELIREYCNKTNNAFFGLIYGFYCAFNPLGLDATKLNGQIYPITMHIDEAMTVPKINAPFDIIEQPPDYLEDLEHFNDDLEGEEKRKKKMKKELDKEINKMIKNKDEDSEWEEEEDGDDEEELELLKKKRDEEKEEKYKEDIENGIQKLLNDDDEDGSDWKEYEAEEEVDELKTLKKRHKRHKKTDEDRLKDDIERVFKE